MTRSSSSKLSKPPIVPPPNAPLLTKESFEKELKALASKAKEETWSKWAGEQAWVLAQSATLLTLAAIYSNVSQMSLSPVYGGIPASILHAKGVMSACFLGWSSNLFIRRNLPIRHPKHLLPVIAAYIPLTQYLLFHLSGLLTAKYGPIITETLTFLPLLLLSVSCTATILDDLELRGPGKLQWLSDSMPGIGSFTFFKVMEYVSNGKIQELIGTSFVFTRLGMQIILAGLYSVFAPSKLLIYAIPAVMHTALWNPHVQTPWGTAQLNSTLAKSKGGWSVLERKESLTGYISILETAEDGFRAMRCDHSLLGGEWLPKGTRNTIEEPIYGVFVMLEAVRLMEVEPPIRDSEAKALVIGLGIGTTPAALMAHGIQTTIVEIDPVVHDFAMKYFALPPRHTAIIQDAVSYAAALARTDDKYDYIVHDVFTGGAEPVELFTFEFLQDLHSILKPGGVIAINYAGDLLLPSPRIIINTIFAIFPTCRIYRESAADEDYIEEGGRDFTNMVIFCTNAAKNVTFRRPVQKDLLGSKARGMFLFPEHEVDYSVFELQEGDGGILRRNDTERFKAWQDHTALGHWAVMRTVLPEAVWQNW